MPTKKDFCAVARILSQSVHSQYPSAVYEAGAREARSYVAYALADWYARQNPRFDRSRFLAACGISVNESGRA